MASSFRTALVDYDEDLFSPRGWEGDLLAKAGIEWVTGQNRDPESVYQAAREADVVIVQSVRPLMTRAIIERLERCRCIVRLGIGYDSVDLAAATERGILVCNVPAYCVDDVADHALALLMGGVRQIALLDRRVRAGSWDRSCIRSTPRMKGCTLGLVAFGRIARAVAERVSGFGMLVLAYDPYVDTATIGSHGAKKVELDDLLQRSDFISVHPPLTDETRHMLSRREFGLMKDTVILVNTSRGPVIDEAALVEALRAGRIAHVGLDVMENEPLPLDSPLREFENVTLTPHVAASSLASVDDLYRLGCQIAIDVANGVWPASVVNHEVEGRTAYPHRRR